MPELNPLSNEQIFLKKIAENTGSDYNTGDVSEINPLTIDQILLKEIAANTAGQSGDITELEGKVTANTSAIEAIIGVNGSCNILPCSATSQTIEGITWTVNSDGTVTASGTATANGSVLTYHRFTSECVLNGKEVVIKGCPAGGSASSYTIEGFRVAGSSSYQDNRAEYGEGVKFTWNNDSSQVVPEIQLYIAPNYAIQGTLTFKPMLYDARLNPTGYVPYAMTNRELTDAVNPLSNGILPFLTMGALKGDASDPINIDTINIGSGYFMRIYESGGFSGTSPSSVLGGSNSYMLAGFSAMANIQGAPVPVYGIQIAFGFGSSTIAIRNAPYQQYSWNQWKQLIGS